MNREISPPWGQDAEDAFTAYFNILRRRREEPALDKGSLAIANRLAAACRLSAIAAFLREWRQV